MNKTTTKPGASAPKQPEDPATLKRRADKEAVVIFLMKHLLLWDNPRFIREKGGGFHITDKGTEYSVKGYYGVNPATGKDELFKWHIDSDERENRVVVAAMESAGFSCNKLKTPGEPWYVTFVLPGKKPARIFSAEDPDEPFAVCLAAKKAIDAGAVTLPKAAPLEERKAA